MGQPLKKPGQKARGREASASAAPLQAVSEHGQSGIQQAIVSDLPAGLPVTTEEVALLRAFLRNEIQHILDSES